MTKRIDKVKEYWAIIVVVAILVIVPIYEHNFYFDMLFGKAIAYTAVALVGIAGFVVLYLASLTGQKNKITLELPKHSVDVTCVGAIALVTFALVSTTLSKYPESSFWGTSGWCIGSGMILMTVVLGMMLSRSLKFKTNMLIPVVLVNYFVFILAILHTARIDVLGYHENIADKQYYMYLSTIGNANWFSGYLCLLMPVILVMFLLSETIISQVMYGMFLVLGEFTILCCSSDSIFIGIGLAAFVIIPLVVRNHKYVIKIGILVLTLGIEIQIMLYEYSFRGKLESLNGLFEKVISQPVAISCMVVGAVIVAGGIVLRNKLSENQCKHISYGLIVALGIVVIAFVAINVMSFDDSWGTKRGLTWRTSWEMYLGFGGVQKLVGVGPETLRFYYGELSNSFSRPIVSAHSEPLQLLMTTGIMGLISWAVMWFGIIRDYISLKAPSEFQLAFFAALVAYLGQSFVNGPMALNVAVFMVTLICYRAMKHI